MPIIKHLNLKTQYLVNAQHICTMYMLEKLISYKHSLLTFGVFTA